MYYGQTSKCLTDELMPPDPKHMGCIHAPPHIICQYPLEAYRYTGEHTDVWGVFGHMGASNCTGRIQTLGVYKCTGAYRCPLGQTPMPVSKVETSHLKLIPTHKELGK